MKKKLLLLMIIICVCVFIFSLNKIIMWKQDNNENETTIKEIKDLITEEDLQIETKKDELIEKLNKLKSQNKDTVAYLKVNNTKIDYPVVQTNDNKYYLTHNFNKKANSAGWVFADYHNKYNGKDKNLVIYGHSMLNGSMFGTLRYVLQEKWYKNKDNHKILLVTNNTKQYYQVFSTYVIDTEDYYINTKFKDNNEFYKFITKLKNRSKFNYNVDLKKTDKILTLSTCYTGGTKRVVLHAKLISE